MRTSSVWSRRCSRQRLLTYGLAGAGALALGVDLAARPADARTAAIEPAKAKVDGDLNYFNWADYVDPTIIKGFEKEYGVKVHQTYFDSDDAMVDKLAAGLPYDFVNTNSAYLPRLVQAGLLRPIDHSQLTNWNQLQPYFRSPFYDPGARYSLPWGYSATGIAWRTDRVKPMKGVWNDLWSHPEAKGKIFFLDQIEETIGASLLRLGYDINSGIQSQVDRAANELIKIKPMLGGFSTNTTNNLVTGRAWIHHAWTPDVLHALQQVKHPETIRFEVCRDGMPLGCDLMSIGKNAKHPGTATLFIDWMLAPENAAKNAVYTAQLVGTRAGDAAYNKVTKDYPFFRFATGVLERGKWKLAPDAQRLRQWNQEWIRVKAS